MPAAWPSVRPLSTLPAQLQGPPLQPAARVHNGSETPAEIPIVPRMTHIGTKTSWKIIEFSKNTVPHSPKKWMILPHKVASNAPTVGPVKSLKGTITGRV